MFQSLQACRAAAAMLVVLFHLSGTFAQPKYFGFDALAGVFGWGDAGVDFFFVLSGFLIASVHARDFGRPQALRDYLVKRALRIYPTYLLICLAVGGAALVVPALRAALPSDALTFVKALALWPQDPAIVGGTGSPILFVAWSLQYEMLFYAVIAVAIANRGAGVLLAAALLLLNLGCRFGSACEFPRSLIASNLIFLFALGVAAAALARSSWRLSRPGLVAALTGAAFIAFGLLEGAIGRDLPGVDRRLVYGALAALLIVALVRAEAAGAFRAEAQGASRILQRWVALLGDSSYALYLLHVPVISVLAKGFAHLGLVSHTALLGVFALIFAACVGAAVLFYVAIERPMLRFFRGLRAPPHAAPEAAASPVPAGASTHTLGARSQSVRWL